MTLFAAAWFVLLQYLALYVDRLYADEEIVLRLANHLVAKNTLNTNWSQVEEIHRYYPNDQFNFSSAVLFYRYFGDILQPLIIRPPVGEHFAIYELRFAAVICSTLAIPLFYLAFRRLTEPVTAALAVVVGFASYQTLTDSVQARPEAFILLVFAGGLLASIEAGLRSGWRRNVALVIAGVCLGLLIASKFSLIICAALFGGLALLLNPPSTVPAFMSAGSVITGILLGGALLGLFVGAPFAVLNPAATIHGIEALAHQYSEAHLPYGRPDYTFVERLSYGGNQLASHLGWGVCIAALVGLAVVARRRGWALLVLIAASFIFCAFFLQTPVFFSRNYALVVPIIALAAAIGVTVLVFAVEQRLGRWGGTGVAVLLSAALLVQPVMASAGVARSIEQHYERVAAEHGTRAMVADAYNVEIAEGSSWLNDEALKGFVDLARQSGPRIYYFWRQNDPYSQRTIDKLVRDYGFEEIAYEAGDLASFPQSMIHFNFDRGYSLLLHDPGRREGPSENRLAAFSPLDEVCVGRASNVQTAGGFRPSGLHSSVHVPNGLAAFGSWLGSDAALASLKLEVSGNSGEWVVPVLSGPGKAGQSVAFSDEDGTLENHSISTSHYWVALHIQTSDGRFTVEARDQGSGWGEWMALGYPAPVVACSSPGAVRWSLARKFPPAARFSLLP